MKWIGIIVATCIVIYYAYGIGHQQAVRHAPEYVAAKREQRIADEQFWREMDATPSARERVCEELFVKVEDILKSEALDQPYSGQRE